MYSKTFDDLVISEVTTPQSGDILCAHWLKNDSRLFMDVSAQNVSDGQTAYMFADKLIVTVHWSDISEADMSQLVNNSLSLRAGVLPEGLFLFSRFGGYSWGDVILLPGLMSSMNTPGKLIDEIIFLFVESRTAKVLASRSFSVSGEFAKFLTYGSYKSYKFFHESDMKKDSYLSVRDMQDDWISLTNSAFLKIRLMDLDKLSESKGIYGMDADRGDYAKFYRF